MESNELVTDLLAACQAQHDAIDELMARLIILTNRYTPHRVFYPSESGTPWDALRLGNAAIAKARIGNPHLIDTVKDAARWRLLRALLGYVGDGSHQSVDIGQDDATRGWVLRVGTSTRNMRSYYGDSIDSVLSQASGGFK